MIQVNALRNLSIRVDSSEFAVRFDSLGTQHDPVLGTNSKLTDFASVG
jgi:hypothetical protein